jgi:hypothetical protein
MIGAVPMRKKALENAYKVRNKITMSREPDHAGERRKIRFS